MEHKHETHGDDKSQVAAKWVFAGFALIAAYFLITEHRAHVAGWLSAYGIWLFVLACPLMHLFMHHGHSDHDSGKASNESPKEKQ